MMSDADLRAALAAAAYDVASAAMYGVSRQRMSRLEAVLDDLRHSAALRGIDPEPHEAEGWRRVRELAQ